MDCDAPAPCQVSNPLHLMCRQLGVAWRELAPHDAESCPLFDSAPPPVATQAISPRPPAEGPSISYDLL